MHSKRISKSQQSANDRCSVRNSRLAQSKYSSTLRPFKKVEKALAGSEVLQTSEKISKRMGHVGTRDTKPELAVRKIASYLRLRYTIQNGDLPGSPDLANRRRRLAIFVHGCYWHRHEGCSKATFPKTNSRFWSNKFKRNVDRDSAATVKLKVMGFEVLVVWECETKDRQLIEARFASMLESHSVWQRSPH
jgi:DNA mismatch endonuclease, patch repair protein